MVSTHFIDHLGLCSLYAQLFSDPHSVLLQYDIESIQGLSPYSEEFI